MYANDDIYSGPTDPTNKINPKIVGAFYINTTTAKLFVCTNNTINNNIWKMCNPDVKIPEIPKIPDLPFTHNYKPFANKYRPAVIYTNTTGYPIHLSYFDGMERDGSGAYIQDITNNIYLSVNTGATYGDIVSAIILPNIKFRCYRWDGRIVNPLIFSLEHI